MIVKLLTEHQFKFLSLKGGCKGSSESTLIKIPHCWKSHVAAHIVLMYIHTADMVPRKTGRVPLILYTYLLFFCSLDLVGC